MPLSPSFSNSHYHDQQYTAACHHKYSTVWEYCEEIDSLSSLLVLMSNICSVIEAWVVNKSTGEEGWWKCREEIWTLKCYHISSTHTEPPKSEHPSLDWPATQRSYLQPVKIMFTADSCLTGFSSSAPCNEFDFGCSTQAWDRGWHLRCKEVKCLQSTCVKLQC